MPRTIRTLALGAVSALAALSAAVAVHAQSQGPARPLNVEIDHATRVQLRAPAGSVIVANPRIADVTVVDANTLFITGKGYGVTEVVAVDDVSLSIEKGDVFGIIGYSGAGKSTLVRLINALEPATRGSIVVDGVDLTTLGERELRRVRGGIGIGIGLSAFHADRHHAVNSLAIAHDHLGQ